MNRFPIPVLAVTALLGCGGNEERPSPARHTRLELRRDGGAGQLVLTVDGAGGPVFLRGQRGALSYGAGETHIATIDTSRCSVSRYWKSQDEYLDAAQRNRLNLLHVELWNVWEPEAPYPFLRDASGRFRVQAAVEGGQWNEEYFAAVRKLVEGASARGIVILFSLFNHYNIRVSDPNYGGRPWAAEPFRAANTDTGFGLEEYGGEVRRRMAEFLRFADDRGQPTVVGRVQKALVERLLEEIDEQNVAFELLMTPWMVNNPYIDGLGLARWESWVVSVVRQKEHALGRSVAAPLMVTPATLHSFALMIDGQVNMDYEVTQWKQAYASGQAGYEGWPEVAILDYAGASAFDDPPFPDGADAYMELRLAAHQAEFPGTTALYNTDGFNKRYAPGTCTAALGEYVQDVRHGWWDGQFSGVDLSLFPRRWAERTYALSQDFPAGTVHFLNWSTAQSSMEDLAGGPW
jgi:hypothetical protein